LQNVTTTAGKQKLAVYVTGSSGVFEGKTVSSRLIQNFTNSGAYAMVDRTSDFKTELRVQQSGKVDDGQLSRLGRQFGVNLVCVVDVLSTNYTAVRMINVETGIIVATAESLNWHIENVDAITKELLSQTDAVVIYSKKDEKLTPFVGKCREGLTPVNGVCRDLSSGVVYWNKSWLGFEVMSNPVIAKTEDIVLNSSSVCPTGWRMPTETEMRRLEIIKDEWWHEPRYLYVTSTFRPHKVFPGNMKDSISVYTYTFFYWNDTESKTLSYKEKDLLTIKFNKKRVEVGRVYEPGTYRVQCVRD
jgi:hypothetical protein